jgi:TRAP-type C4-dicarboxylate transport system permease small subunit
MTGSGGTRGFTKRYAPCNKIRKIPHVRRVINAIDTLFLYFSGMSLVLVVVICLMQVIARYAFNASFSWAEEISVTLVLWSVWAGASLAVKSNTHLRLFFVEKKLPRKKRYVLRIIINLIIVIFVVSIAYASRIVINMNENITLMSLPITVNVMYWSIPFGCLLMTFYCFRSIWNDLKGFIADGTEG